MGLYNINCQIKECNTPFTWFSGNPLQICEKCMKNLKVTKKKEDASVNSLGSIPVGRLVKKKNVRKLINPLKGESMTLAKKYLGILFEDDMAEPTAPIEPEMVDTDGGEEDPKGQMMVACAEVQDLVKEMEDGEMKDKLLAACDKMMSLCGKEEPSEPVEPEEVEPEAEEPESDKE